MNTNEHKLKLIIKNQLHDPMGGQHVFSGVNINQKNIRVHLRFLSKSFATAGTHEHAATINNVRSAKEHRGENIQWGVIA
jgi:hypothetical protein